MSIFKQYVREVNIRSYLENRDVVLNDTRYPVYVDEKEDIAFFPLFNLSGKFVGYQRMNPKGLKNPTEKQRKIMHSSDFKYYTYTTKENPEKNIHYIGVYGLHTLDKKRNYLFITEGIFDTVKLIRLNQPTIAVLANHPKHLKNLFFTLQKRIIAILDRDVAGSKLKSLADESYVVPEPYKDLGDMSIDEVRLFISGIKGIKL